MICNNNIGKVSIPLQDVFAMYDLKPIYEKYKQKLKKLER